MNNYKWYSKAALLALSLTAATAAKADLVIENEFEIKEKNVFFLSPHPDDTLLTFGGLINNMQLTNQLEDKNVIGEVFFSMSNYTTNHLDELTNKRIFDVTTMRFNEDLAAHIDMFKSWDKFRYKTNGFGDAPLRKYQGSKTAGGGPGGDFADFRESEAQIYLRMAEDMKPMLKTENCAVFALIANGSHIDHFIVREALIKAAYDLGDEVQCQIYFGEDQPYTGSNLKKRDDQYKSLKERLPKGALTPRDYGVDYRYKMALYKKHYLSQYDASGYIPSLKKNKIERLYTWDKASYKKIKTHPHCKGEYCELND
ncbi:hypothetical protein OPW41_20720 [Vibrio europaeus]|uniref:PIG-L family deacetylase n=1 Tax=Vibrio europaeus TaxID=300876 RepID=A0A178JGB1_9VIBR|nr:hypothetical protein [Vibrio europaeus]MDC5707244.1 hypothetical protein [Vibrio europaeus]MDC5712609.1 hypothetical protein [Vibrio europaeus]MDC5717252.1 hypothetical protein [Vibrio europaeus]MDC5721214.1 hypothetical protein [Vibrio europaeus]MDC5726552.1 hypothetical protein [Vibrio europaeus]